MKEALKRTKNLVIFYLHLFFIRTRKYKTSLLIRCKIVWGLEEREDKNLKTTRALRQTTNRSTKI
jgi:hypothetical protein